MSTSVLEQLHERVHAAFRAALNAAGLEGVEEFRLAPPARPEMGDLGLACHPFARILKKNPKLIAEDIQAQFQLDEGIASSEALNGYVNVHFDSSYLLTHAVLEIFERGDALGKRDEYSGRKLLIEFSGPNTNKPQHLGHARNNVLGLAVSNLFEAIGYDVTRVNIINDRGIHICKSMLAYERFGDGATPESAGRKGDFFVGDYYVRFDQEFEAEYKNSESYAQFVAANPAEGLDKEGEEKRARLAKEHKERYFNEVSDLGLGAKQMLRKWEEEDPQVRSLWQTMNQWVYDGFAQTYARLGIEFDWVDYESETFVLGKDVVQEGVEKGLFHVREDGATVCDLSQIDREGQKVLLRPDGTSLYMTQDLGTADRRLKKFNPERMIYVVADEQNYHFELLFRILSLLEEGLGERCEHLSYGMVELPDGKMKSREGNVVDADNLMSGLQEMALEKVLEHEPELGEEEASLRAERIGQAGLKYFILKFSPHSRIHFDPERSIEFRGDTGPYCLYSYARINSLLNKMPDDFEEKAPTSAQLALLHGEEEIHIAKLLAQFSSVLLRAATESNPSFLTSYLHELSSAFATYYQAKDDDGNTKYPIASAEPPLREARFALSRAVQKVLKRGLALLGIQTIEQM